MSSETELSGHSLKEWSLIVLLVSLAIVFTIIGAGFIIAIINDPSALTITGSFDLSQFTGILIGIAMVAVTMVAQQLTARNQSQIAAQTDKSWIDSDPSLKSKP